MYLRKTQIAMSMYYLLTLMSIILLLATKSARAENLPYQYRKTNTAMFIWGEAKINGDPVAKGATIVARVEGLAINDGCVGLFVVDKPGSYGAIAIYGDDSTTPEKDGARTGDKISLQVIDKESQAVHEFSAPVIWKGNGLVEKVDCH